MRINRRLGAALGALALLAAGLVACSSSEPTDNDGNSSSATAPLLRIGSLQEPTSWDPAQGNEGHAMSIYQSVYDTLIRRTPEGELVPMLATAWETSDDLLSLTLTIREGVTFTDGEALDAAAVKANLEHFQTANGPLGSTLSGVTSIDTPDEHTVVLNLDAPNPSLPYWLSYPPGYMGSPAAIGTDAIITEPVGTGPYILDTSSSIVGSKLVFTRNDDYWGDPLPYDSVEFYILPDDTARLNALKSGQIDAAVLQRLATGADAEAAGFNHVPYSVNWEGVWFFDRDGALLPELADQRVREALTLAIDRDAILEGIQMGKGELTSQVFTPNEAGYIESLDSAYQYDPVRAKELLAEAGAEDLSFTLPISPVFDPAIYDAIIQNWQDIGVTVDRFEWGPGEAIPSMTRGDYPIAYMSLSAREDWAWVNMLLTPNATWNPFGTQNDELDGYFHDLQYATDSAQSVEAAQSINQYVVDNFWFSPMYRLESSFYWNDSVDVQNQPGNIVPFIYNYAPSGN
jgi:peptide/nickel transport system substrate-binding protein